MTGPMCIAIPMTGPDPEPSVNDLIEFRRTNHAIARVLMSLPSKDEPDRMCLGGENQNLKSRYDRANVHCDPHDRAGFH